MNASEEKTSLDQLRIDRGGTDSPGRRSWGWLVLLAVLLVLALAAFLFTRDRVIAVRTQPARAVAPGGSQTVLNASGYVVARRKATVSAKTTGKVLKVLIEEGMKVEEGQVLAQLDDSNVKASLQASEAQLAATQAGLDETQAQLVKAGKDYQRLSALSAQKIASLADLDAAEANLKALQARLRQLERQVSVAEKEVAIWKQQAEDMVVRAPFAGITVSKDAQPGEMISPISAGGGFTRTGIGTIVDMSSLEIEIDVNESYLNRVQPGQPVEATLDAYADWKIPCQVIAIIPTADRQKSTVKVRVGFDHLDPRILPEMSVKVAFRETGAPAVTRSVLVPKNAIRSEAGRDVVYVFQNGQAERRAITAGDAKDDEVAVNAGLSAGEKVIVNPPTGLADGAKVKEAKF